MKKILLCVLLLSSFFLLTGCQEKETDEELVAKAVESIQDIDYYKGTVTFRYSDDSKTINASFVSQVDTEDVLHYVKGKINVNDNTYDTVGYYNDDSFVVQDINGVMTKISQPIIYLKDLKFTNPSYVEFVSGEDNLNYYNVTINDKYKGRIGIGKSDNIIYTVYIDFRNIADPSAVIGVYELDFEIDDMAEEMPSGFDTDIKQESDSFFTIFGGLNKPTTPDEPSEESEEVTDVPTEEDINGGDTNEITE